jgi:hypothetical protein
MDGCRPTGLSMRGRRSVRGVSGLARVDAVSGEGSTPVKHPVQRYHVGRRMWTNGRWEEYIERPGFGENAGRSSDADAERRRWRGQDGQPSRGTSVSGADAWLNDTDVQGFYGNAAAAATGESTGGAEGGAEFRRSRRRAVVRAGRYACACCGVRPDTYLGRPGQLKV